MTMYTREFSGGKSLKFIKHQIPEGFGSVIGEFEEEANVVDFQSKFERILEGMDLEAARWGNTVLVDHEEVNMRVYFKIVMREWKQKFLEALDEHLENKVAEGVLQSSKNRCLIKSTVFNFSGVKVGDDITEALNKGSNYVMHSVGTDQIEARQKFESELFHYLKGYRKYIEKGFFINEYELNAWLNEAIKNSEENHREFYKEMLQHHSVMISRRLIPRNDLNEFGSLDKLGLVAVDCDKNSGIAILKISDMVEADRKMVEELGGIKCAENEAAEVKNKIGAEIYKFEAELTQGSRKFLDVYYPSRRSDLVEAELPFMKLKPKVHKMTEDDLKKGRVQKLKYRPVIDSSRTPVHQYSKAIRYDVTILEE